MSQKNPPAVKKPLVSSPLFLGGGLNRAGKYNANDRKSAWVANFGKSESDVRSGRLRKQPTATCHNRQRSGRS
jgi:hypothetical protein